MMAITTNSSISVNADRDLFFRQRGSGTKRQRELRHMPDTVEKKFPVADKAPQPRLKIRGLIYKDSFHACFARQKNNSPARRLLAY